MDGFGDMDEVEWLGLGDGLEGGKERVTSKMIPRILA